MAGLKDELQLMIRTCLQSSFWGGWGTFNHCGFIPFVLAMRLISLSKIKKVRNLKFSCHPIRPVSDNLSFQFLPVCHVVDPFLRELDSEKII